MGVFALSLMIFAIPAGKLGQKIGRKKTILIGLGGALLLFTLFFLTKEMPSFQKVMIFIALIGGGACVALVNINTLPVVLDIGTPEQVGTFTGYYYTATFSASIVGRSCAVRSVARRVIGLSLFTARLRSLLPSCA